MSSDKFLNQIIIKNATVVNHDHIENADICIEDGMIIFVGKDEKMTVPQGCKVIDAMGKYVIPGGIDPHLHLELNMSGATTVDDFFHGTKAAIAGGTTTIIDFVFVHPGETLVQAYKRIRSIADNKVCCDYGLHAAITHWSDSTKNELKLLSKAYGINAFKSYMTHKDAVMLQDSQLYEVFETCKEVGAIAMVHTENGSIIAKNREKLLKAGITGPIGHLLSAPEEVEAEAVHRACVIAHQTKCPIYIVDVMSKSAAREVGIGRKRYGEHLIIGETLSSALGTDGRSYSDTNWYHAAAHLTCPPLNPDPTTKIFLMEMLNQNVLQVASSDNGTYNREQKELGKDDFSKIPAGVNGVEDRMSVIWEKGVKTGIIDPKRFVEITSTNAAKIFNLYPKKGKIAVGSDADIVIWNGDATRTISAKTHHQACDFNVFEGMTCHGVPELVIVKGKVCYDKGQLHVTPGFGKYLETKPFSPHIYGPLEQHQLLEKHGLKNKL